MSPTDSSSQHVVTAVIVAHDGAAWLPRLMDALTEQTKPVQRVVAVDTGSRDRSGSVLTAQLGPGSVFGMDRSTGYAAAVRRAVQHKAASAPVTGGPSGRSRTDQVEWLWLLHDDCEPAADALEQLLRGAAETPTAAVLGPKLMDWTDRDVILEAGLTIDTVGRRITGIEPREVDQGQHDGDRDAVAVSSAGMLVRRDVWEQAGGFDPGMTLFGEDIDLCWRVHAAGYRVRVITDAVVFHARAATRGRRAISVGRRARLLDRRNGLVTLLGNLPLGAMLISLAGNVILSLARTIFYLVAKRPSAALDESAAVLGVVGHPLKLSNARRRRARGRRAAYSRLRGDLPAGRSIRRVAEFAATVLSRPAPEDLAGAHHASDDPTDDDSLLVDTGVLQRLLTRPGVLLILGLIVIAVVAERSLVASGTLGGGALLPAWEGASGLWSQFLRAYHPSGIGSASAGPPYVGFLAVLATVLLGKVWLAIDVLLLGCVPLAGITATLALRRVTKSVPVRIWAAAAYALLPVAFGAIAAGRLGSAVAFVLIPLIGLLAGRMFTQPQKLARRAAWATGLTVSAAAAFVPLLWPMAVIGAIVACLALRRSGRGLLTNLAIVVLTPPLLLLPWLLPLLAHPRRLLLEAGVQQPGLSSASLPARSLLLLSPGGPGLPPYWVSGPLLLAGLAGLAALLTGRRLTLIVSGWTVAVLGLATGLLASRVTVTPAGGQPVVAWPGVALVVAAAGLLLAAAAAGDGIGRTLSAGGRTGLRRLASVRGLPIAILALAACAAPALAAAYWVTNGISGPIGAASGQVVPSLVSSTGGAGRQLRTLVLAAADGHISFLLLRGGSPEFGDPDLTPAPAAQAALTQAVAILVAPGGGQAADQSQLLARFDIGFVLMRAPLSDSLASVLNGVPGLTGVSMTPQFDLWRLADPPSRVSVVEPNGAVVAVASGPVGVSGASVPSAGGTLLLAEPAGNWSASVSGHALTPVSSPAGSWAQAFKLPPGGGPLTISRNALVHDLVIALELLAFVVVAGLALPGIRTAAELEAEAAGTDGQDSKPSLWAGSEGDLADDDADARQPALVGASRPDGPTASAAVLAIVGAGSGPNSAAATAGASVRAGRPDGQGGKGGRSRRDGPARGKRRGARRSRRASDKLAGGEAAAAGGIAAAAGGASAARGILSAAEAAGSATEIFGAGNASASGRAPGRSGPQGSPGAAWPAGQPANRFLSGPPDSRVRSAGAPGPGRMGGGRYDAEDAGPSYPVRSGRGQPDPRVATDTPYTEAPGYRGGAPAYGGPAHGAAPSPSGTPYGEPFDARPPGRHDRLADTPFEDRSPSGSRYANAADYGEPPSAYRQPDYGQEPAPYGGEPGYAGASGYQDRPAGYGDRAAGPAPHPGQPGYQGQPGHPDQYGHPDTAGQDRQPASWGAGDQPSAWSGPAQQGWSQDYHQQSWPQEDQQQGWPDTQSAAGRGSDWHAPGPHDWPDPDHGLEALPPPGEVHHDWPGHDDRTSRGWPAPGQDDEGESW